MGEKFERISKRELQSFIKIHAYLELWFQLLNIKRIQCCNGAWEDFWSEIILLQFTVLMIDPIHWSYYPA